MTEFLIRLFIKDAEKIDDPDVRRRYGALSGTVGILLNLLLSVGKFLAGLLTGAISMTADAFNNLSDAASSLVTLVGFRLSAKRADSDHPFGHGRMEYLSGLAVSMVILLVGLELLKSSAQKILRPEAAVFSWLSVGILCVSILVKLWMCLFNRALSKRIDSAAMAATAADSLSDCAATGAVLLGALVGHFFTLDIDGYVGILVALFILKSGWDAAKATVDPLLGQSPDPALVRAIRESVLSHREILGVHDLVIHDYGPGRRMMSLHAEVSADADFPAAHDLIDSIERELKAKFHIEATIHMDPIAVGDEATEHTREQVAALVREIHPDMTIHDFRMTNGPHHRNLIFDVSVPYSLSLTDDALREELCRRLKALDAAYYPVIQIDRDYAGAGGR